MVGVMLAIATTLKRPFWKRNLVVFSIAYFFLKIKYSMWLETMGSWSIANAVDSIVNNEKLQQNIEKKKKILDLFLLSLFLG